MANLSRTTTRSGLLALFEKARNAGFTGVVVDVKPTTGEVLYHSRIAPRLRGWHRLDEVRGPRLKEQLAW